MWDALQEIVGMEGRTINELATQIDHHRRGGSSLTSAIRVHIVEFYRSRVLSS